MNFTVDPGLYALGRPNDQTPVLVTANYKMSFDRLRQALPGRDAWILVLNTKGINVWCAAGKGTFGTQELVQRVSSSGLRHVSDCLPACVLGMNNRHVWIKNRDACIECGACARNCPTEAVTVRAGVGCAAAVINAALGRSDSSCCCVIERREGSGKVC